MSVESSSGERRCARTIIAAVAFGISVVGSNLGFSALETVARREECGRTDQACAERVALKYGRIRDGATLFFGAAIGLPLLISLADSRRGDELEV